MKKALNVVLSLIMCVLLVFGTVGCQNNGSNDADKVKDALQAIRVLYENDAEETAGNYKVIGRTKVGDEFYTIDWTISSQTANYQDYISIGEMDPDDNSRLITITLGAEKVEYTLKATVTIGKESGSLEFKHSIPAASNVLTVAKVIELGETLADDAFYEVDGVVTPVIVKGYVVDAGNWNSQYKNLNKVYIADTYSDEMTKDSEGTFYVYRIAQDNMYNTQEGSIEKGDLITVSGPLQNYKGDNTSNTLELTPITKEPKINVTVTDLVKQPTKTDAERVALAKAEVDIAKEYNAVTEVTLPAAKRGAKLDWAVKVASEFVTVEENVLKIVKLPTADTEVTLTVTITSGTESDTKDITITLKPAPTVEKIYTAAEANALGKTLAADAFHEENGAKAKIKVKGYVAQFTAYSTQYKNWDNIFITDELDGTEKFLIFRLGLDTKYLIESTDLKLDDVITVEGYLQNHKGNKVELTDPVCVGLEKTTLTDEQKATRAINKVTLPETVTENVALPTSAVDGVTLEFVSDNEAIKIESGNMVVTPADADVDVTITATAKSGNVTKTKEFTVTVKAPIEASLLATFALGANVDTGTHADGQSNATYTETVGSYTLNVTDGTRLYTGANDKQGNSGFKMGTSSAAGSFKFTVGDNVKQVIVYVAGYKARTTKVSVNGGAAVEITEKSDEGNYFALKIDTTTTKEITISTDSSAARCMINTIEFWG